MFYFGSGIRALGALELRLKAFSIIIQSSSFIFSTKSTRNGSVICLQSDTIGLFTDRA